jgi:hypothetical protein
MVLPYYEVMRCHTRMALLSVQVAVTDHLYPDPGG